MDTVNPYQELVGDGWNTIRPSVRLAHKVPLSATGTMNIRWGKNPLVHLIGKIVKLPPPGDSIPTTLKIEQTEKGIVWDRNFNGFRAKSLHTIANGVAMEEAGPFTYLIRMEARGDTIVHVQAGLKMFGIRVPMWFGPAVTGQVLPGIDDQSWKVEVDIRHWFLGRILSYQGEMTGQ